MENPENTCRDCRSCGPDRPKGLIRCDDASWEDEPLDSELREIDPTFAEVCADFEPKEKP